MSIGENGSKPFGNLGIIALKSCRELGEKIDRHLRENLEGSEKVPKSYLIDISERRFANGEGKVIINESVRGRDIYLLCDVGNYGCTYEMYGMDVPMSPDEHFQDLKRAISAIGGKSRKTTVIMPKFYSARQDRRKNRESLDCANALQELENLGIKDIITFDVHDSRVQNAVPQCSFENLYATYEIVKDFMGDEGDIVRDKDNFLVISPDSGGMDRAIYYSTVLDVDVGLFYKRRDFSRFVDGHHPIAQHEYMGRSVEDKNIIIIDDEIASGQSILDLLKELKERKAAKVFVAVSFALFVKGISQFEEYYRNGYFERIYTTNLTYVSDSARNSGWLKVCDMSGYISNLITLLNRNSSIEPLMDATNHLRELIMEARENKK
jgi:ribose-phosphate pyrophosphokinase